MTPFDAAGAFRPVAEGAKLRRLAVRGAGATVFSNGVAFALQMIATIVLARLLTPADFGLVTMATTFSLLLMNLGLNGFTEAMLQRQDIDHFLASNLFWINAGLGLVLTAAFAVSGSLLAHFYGDPRVGGIAAALALTILFTSLSVQHLALLMRAMRFPEIAANGIVARAVSVIVSILFAWAGWGYWALVSGAVALPLATTIGAWMICRWVPALPRRRVGTEAMVRFAINTYGRFTINYFTRNLDNLLIGWRFDAQGLGFYKKAYDVFILPAAQLSAPLNGVAVSTLSRLTHDPAQRERYLLKALATLAFVGMGVGAVLTLVGFDVILLLLGPGWEVSGRIFTFFGPGIGMMLLYGTHAWIHLSLGRADRWFRWAIVECVVTGLLFAAGLRWGLTGMAVAWVVSFWILTIPALWYAARPMNLGVAPIVGAVWKYLVASALGAGVSVLMLHEMPAVVAATGVVGAIVRIAVVSTLFAVSYLCAVILLHRGCDPLRHIAGLLRDMLVPGGRTPVEATSHAR